MKLALYKCTLLLLTYLYIQLSRILLYIIEICWSQLFFFSKIPNNYKGQFHEENSGRVGGRAMQEAYQLYRYLQLATK